MTKIKQQYLNRYPFWVCDCSPPFSDLNYHEVKKCELCGSIKPNYPSKNKAMSELTHKEVSRRGGLATKKKFGVKHFRKLWEKGQEVIKNKKNGKDKK